MEKISGKGRTYGVNHTPDVKRGIGGSAISRFRKLDPLVVDPEVDKGDLTLSPKQVKQPAAQGSSE